MPDRPWERGLARLLAAGIFATAMTAAPTAKAQVHWDAAARVGVEKRFLTGRPAGGDDAGLGPTAELAAHLALLPLLRTGVYVGHAIAPLGGDAAARNVTFGGLRAKVMSPWPRGAFRGWLFAGFGFAGVYAPSYGTQVVLTTPGGSPASREALVTGAGGHYFEVPFGIGASYKLRKPFELCAELGAKVGFGHSGSIYEDPGRAFFAAGFPENRLLPAGVDRFVLGLTVGVLVDL